MFVHDAVLEYIRVGCTVVHRKELLTYYNLLVRSHQHSVTDDVQRPKNVIEKQFEVIYIFQMILKLISYLPQHLKRHLEVPVENSFAMRTMNRDKNRQGALLPIFKSCVRLRDKNSSEEGSEYINASYLQVGHDCVPKVSIYNCPFVPRVTGTVPSL